MSSRSTKSRARQWEDLSHAIYATRDNEIICDQAAIQMAQRFSTTLTETEAMQQFPALFVHFQFCSDCAAEYQMLAELTEIESTGQMVGLTRIPPRPDKQSAFRMLRDIIEHSFAGFMLPSIQPSASRRRGTKMGIAPVTMQLTAQLMLTLDVDQSENAPHLRSLMCTLEQETTEPDLFEGISLQLEDANGQISEEALDVFGGALFDLLPPSVYHLHFSLAGQLYMIRDIELP